MRKIEKSPLFAEILNKKAAKMKYLLFPSAVIASFFLVFVANTQKVVSYENHEFYFISGLTGFAGKTQQQADAICIANFKDMRRQGIFNQKVEDNTWHVWAHLNHQQCIMNIRFHNFQEERFGIWTPSNNNAKSFPIRIPVFRN